MPFTFSDLTKIKCPLSVGIKTFTNFRDLLRQAMLVFGKVG
jgi:hypothetical protein